nr:hypothetical protein [Desulfobulbaceae bacterium]
MNILTTIILLPALLYLAGCASTVPDKSSIHSSYSIAEVKSFSSVLNCDNTKVTKIRADFVGDYCQILAANIRVSLQRENPNFKYDESNPELVVHTTLEEINGGNERDRFWFGFGLDWSTTKIFVKVVKSGDIIAERLITEQTIMPILAIDNFAGEDAILQDAPVIARKIVKFIKDPINFEKNETKSWGSMLEIGN